MKKQLTNEQIQSVLDSYSVGKIDEIYHMSPRSLTYNNEDVILNRIIVETNQGVFFLIYSLNDEIHQAWWESNKNSFSALITNALKLQNAKILITNTRIDTVHKFNLRFCLFSI